MLSKYAAAPLVALAVSAAADSSCSFSATTITAAADATALAGCTAISGNIAFASGAAAPTLSLDQVGEIDGDWSYENDDTVSAISAPKLSKITGAMLFSNLSSLSTISLGSLETSGDVTLKGCPDLQSVTTGTQYQEAKNVMIENTQLTSLGGFGNLSKISAISAGGNSRLADITMNIGSVQSISIGSNEEQNNGLSVSFDNLTSAGMIVVNNATSVSFASLKKTTGGLSFFYNNFETFSLPNLTQCGGLSIVSNNKLDNISLPQLSAIDGGSSGGSLVISNNTGLTSVGGFDNLQNVNGAVTLAGTFQNITSLNFKRVNGTFRVSSTADIGNSICPEIKDLWSHQVIAGAWSCTGQSKSASSGVAGSNTGGGSSSSSSSAAGPIEIPALPAISAGFGAFLLQFLLSF